jgi:phosphatidylinositol alpha-1,6-mannosyltransferase
MPNIHDPGTMEGFGLVILEAGSCGTPVIASAIEGITDAVVPGATGRLVAERDAEGFIRGIHALHLSRKKIISTIKRRFDWSSIAGQYLKDMKSI